jgi:hypothetical protein
MPVSFTRHTDSGSEVIAADHVNELQVVLEDVVDDIELLEVNQYTLDTNGGTGTFTPDAAAYRKHVINLAGNITIAAPTNPANGRELTFIINQDLVGGKTITWNAVFFNTPPTISTSYGTTLSTFIYYVGVGWINKSVPKNYVDTETTSAKARANHTGTQSADTLTDGTTNKAFLATERTKLTGIATGATANATDAQLRDRSTHTNTQTASTISDFAATARSSTTTQGPPTLQSSASGTYTPDAAANITHILVTASPSLTIAAPTNAVAGRVLNFVIRHSTTPYAVSWNATYKNVPFISNVASTASPATFIYDGVNWIGPRGPATPHLLLIPVNQSIANATIVTFQFGAAGASVKSGNAYGEWVSGQNIVTIPFAGVWRVAMLANWSYDGGNNTRDSFDSYIQLVCSNSNYSLMWRGGFSQSYFAPMAIEAAGYMAAGTTFGANLYVNSGWAGTIIGAYSYVMMQYLGPGA